MALSFVSLNGRLNMLSFVCWLTFEFSGTRRRIRWDCWFCVFQYFIRLRILRQTEKAIFSFLIHKYQAGGPKIWLLQIKKKI